MFINLRRLRSGLVAVGTMCLASCANFEGRIAPLVSLEDVADNIQCELKAAYKRYQSQEEYEWLEHWAATFTLTMKRQDKAGLAPKFDYLEPDVFGIGATGELSTDTIRSLTTKRTLLLHKLTDYKCKAVNPGLLTGRLGLEESIGEALRVRGMDDVTGIEPDDLGYHIDFALKLGAGVSPSWILTRIPGVGFGASGSSETTHTLDIAFADNSPKRPQKVCVVNPPGSWAWCDALEPPPAKKPVPGAKTPQRGKSLAIGRRPPVQSGVRRDTKDRLDNTLMRMQLQNLQLRR